MSEKIFFNTCQNVLQYLANAFYSEESAETWREHNLGSQSFLEDLKTIFQDCGNLPRWDLLTIARTKMFALMKYEQRERRQRHLAPDEGAFMAELALHLHDGQKMLRLPWSLLEQISAMRISDNLLVGHLRDAQLPDSIWLEWSSVPPPDRDPWISRVAGLLISRISLYDAPPEYQRNLVRMTSVTKGQSDSFELSRTLLDLAGDGVPCYGLLITAVQKVEDKFKFVPFALGHELTGSVKDMLVLHQEILLRDRRGRKRIELIWANVAVRLLLVSVFCHWFDNDKQINIADNTLAEFAGGPGLIYSSKKKGRRIIQIRKQKNEPWQPFFVEK